MEGELGPNGGLPIDVPLLPQTAYRLPSYPRLRQTLVHSQSERSVAHGVPPFCQRSLRGALHTPVTTRVAAASSAWRGGVTGTCSAQQPVDCALPRAPGCHQPREPRADLQGMPAIKAFLGMYLLPWFTVSPDCDTSATGWSNIAVRLLTSAPLALDKYDGTRPEDD